MVREGQATLAEATRVKDFLDDFLGLDTPVEKMRLRLADPNIITAIEPGVGYCQIKIRKEEKSAKVEALFPRGADAGVLRPLLQEALKIVKQRHASAGSWRMWASFWKATDAQGKRDGGESECLTWQAQYPPGVVTVTAPGDRLPGGAVNEAGVFVAESTLDRVLAA